MDQAVRLTENRYLVRQGNRDLTILFAFFGLMELRLRFNFTVSALQALFGNTVFDERMQAEQTGKLVVALLMIGVLLIDERGNRL